LQIAEAHTEKLGRERLAWTDAITSLRRAGIRDARGDAGGAVREFRAAVTACDAAALGLHAAAARVRLGELVRGDEGNTLRDAGLAALRAEEVKNPDAFVALYSP
jgi:hypothetical protein